MLLTARAHGLQETLVILGALGAVMALSFIALVAARPIIRALGSQVEAVITRAARRAAGGTGGTVRDRRAEGAVLKVFLSAEAGGGISRSARPPIQGTLVGGRAGAGWCR
jgi:hypothetical protein